MKQSLRNYQRVEQVLKAIATGVTNGNSLQVKCYHFDTQHVKSKEYADLEAKIIKKKFANLDYSEEYRQLAELPQGKAILVFKLLEPMTIKGTKQVVHNGKAVSPEIKNCTEIYIPEDIINNDNAGLQYDQTDEKETDASGSESPVIILDLGKCIIDVAQGKRDWRDQSKWLVAPRAYVTDIPFRSMQVIGSMIGKEENRNREVLNYLSDDQLLNS
jgi:hypothetical protein